MVHLPPLGFTAWGTAGVGHNEKTETVFGGIAVVMCWMMSCSSGVHVHLLAWQSVRIKQMTQSKNVKMSMLLLIFFAQILLVIGPGV